MVSNFSASQYVAKNAASADRFPAPPTYRGICGAVKRSATWKGLPGTCGTMKRWTDLHFVVACRIACGSAHSPPALSMSAAAFQITTCRIAAEAAAALHATDGVGSCCAADASAAAACAPHRVSCAPPVSRFAFPPLPAVFCTGPPTVVAPTLVAVPVFPTAKTGVSLAATSALRLQGQQVSPVSSLSCPHPAAGQQTWFRSLSTSQNIVVSLRDVDDCQQPHDEEGHRQYERPYQDLPQAGQQQQQQQHQRYPKQQQQQHQLYRRVQQHSYAVSRRGQLLVQEHRWDRQWDPHYALHGPLFRQQLQKGSLREQRRHQHEFQEPTSEQRQRLGETQHIGDQLHCRKGKEQLLLQSRAGGGAQVSFFCCSSTQLSAHLMPPLMHYGYLPSSRLLLFKKRSSGVLSAAGACCFSTTLSERLTREMERHLLRQGENTGMGTAAAYDRRRQGIVLAVADDVLLTRGLAAAPVGTLVTFTHTGDGQVAATASTAAAGDSRQAPPAAKVAEAAAAGKAAEPQKGVGGTRDAGSEEQPAAPVLGVVLQLLQQDLNILGLLGGSSNFSSSTGECLPFRVPRIGDLCTAVSAYVGHLPQRQQDVPAHAQQSQRDQCMQNVQGDQWPLHQQEGRQPTQKQCKPYQLMDSVSPDCSSRVVSPMALLHRVVPATETADRDSKASVSEVFFNVLDFSQPTVPKACPRTAVKLPWGLPTGSAAVDAVAPLQVGETSAFLGPPGTGKTHALVPAVALHAAAAAAAAVVDASPAASSRLLPTAANEAPPQVTMQTGRVQPQQKLSVVFLSFGSSPSSLRRWLDAVSRETAECSAAACARNAAWEAAHREDLMTAAKTGDQSEDARSSAALPPRWASTVGAADAFSAYVTRAAQTGTTSSTAGVSTPLKNMVVLHVPAPSVRAPEGAAAGAAAEKTDSCGRRVHPTSTLMYLAPVLALRLTLEAQAVAAVHGTPCPVLLVIDGMAMHASAVEQLQMNIQKLLCSQSAALHVPAGLAGLSPPGPKMPLPPGAAAGSSAAAAAAVALPFSATSLYGMLSCRTSRATGATGPLSMLLVLDTPSDPALLTARNLQRSASSLVQQQRIEKTLHQTIKGEGSVGVVLSQKLAREVQEALLSTAQRTILFAVSTQQQRQGQSAAEAAHKAVQRDQQQRQQRMKARTEAGRRGGVPLAPIYPMIDIDSVVASSTAALSADACAALSQSCFTRRDSPTAEEDGAALQALRDAIEALCRRQLRAEKHLLHSTSSSRIPDIAHMSSTTSEGTNVGMKTATATGKLLFEPPALLAAAGAAFAWQRRVLHSESERQQLMQQFRLFVDVWEEEDVDSLSIASAVCLARPVGRIFSPTEQLVLLRAAATMVFTPFGAPTATAEGERGRSAGRGCAAASTSAELGGGAESRQKVTLSFAQICAFQEDLLHEFREKEPLLWDNVQQHLQRAGEWPMQLQSGELDTVNTKATKEGAVTWSSPHQEETRQENTGLQTVAEEEEQVQHMAQHVVRLISRVDKALLDMRSSFDITSPCFPDD